MSADQRETLDPRWEWVEINGFASPGPEYIKGRCRHLEVVPVDTSEGERVAHLCLTCDAQLPAEWQP